MDWLTGIQKAIDHVEAHLTDEIDYEEVARQAYCSSFYFQRIFGILCGMPLGEYVRNRRLTLAGNELSATDSKVIDIALKYGYESPESFTRAFVKFHGITPSEAKKNGSKLRSFSRLSVKIILTGGSSMNYKIIEKEAFYVLERVEKHSVVNGENLNTIPAFWNRAHTDGSVVKLLANATDRTFVFGICYASSSQADTEFEYSIATVCDKDTVAPDGFRKNIIPARTWAVFECRGAMPKAIQDLWQKICTEFFPTAEYEPTREMDIEAYPYGDMGSEDYYSEIWIPVMK